jgi:type II secretion system protein H
MKLNPTGAAFLDERRVAQRLECGDSSPLCVEDSPRLWLRGPGRTVCLKAAINSDASRAGRRTPNAPRAFTLIELILVLALLAIATSLAAPSLSSFFKGRALDSAARQLLSLTHAGQSRAVSEGFPMLLWIDSQEHAYGLREESSSRNRQSQEADPRAEEFVFDEQLRIEAVNASPLPVNGRSLPAIRFLPDGTIDEGSASTLRFSGPNGDTLWLIEATNRMSYEIRNTDRQ